MNLRLKKTGLTVIIVYCYTLFILLFFNDIA